MNDPINREHLNEITGGDEEFAQELLEEYLNSTGKLVEELDSIGDNPDCEKLRSLAHAIKGSSLSVGADSIAAAAKQIEDNARNGSAENLADYVTVIRENISFLKGMESGRDRS